MVTFYIYIIETKQTLKQNIMNAMNEYQQALQEKLLHIDLGDNITQESFVSEFYDLLSYDYKMMGEDYNEEDLKDSIAEYWLDYIED